jgi:APA family basic amino acid/polyamine antiporter
MVKLKLKRSLGLFSAAFYGIGIILGAGIYFLIGPASGLAGNAIWLSFVIGALVASFTGLSYAELSAMYPQSAAEFVYVKKAYGSNFWAFLIGWLLIFTGIISAATVSLGFSGYLAHILEMIAGIPISYVLIVGISLILLGLLSFVNFLGIEESSKLNIIFTSIEMFGLILIIILGLGTFGKVNYLEMPKGLKGVFSAAALIFFAYIGFEDVVNISEETKSPKKCIPKAIILAVIITTLLYVLTSVSCIGLVGWSELSTSSAPLALCASKSFLGENTLYLLSFIALFATTNTVLIILIVSSRMLYGMANNGSLPRKLSKIHIRRQTPWLAILVIMGLSMAFVFLGNIELIANVTSLGMFITFIAVNASLIWLRLTRPELHRPFKVPLNIGKYPILPILGIITCVFMIFQFEWNLLLFGLGLIIAGVVFYIIYNRKFIFI